MFKRFLLAAMVLICVKSAFASDTALDSSADNSSVYNPKTTVFIEAESFADANNGEAGGWTLDPQFIDSVGSSVLLSHGLGKPVADAQQNVEFPQTGEYHVWVRTRNWGAEWAPDEAPGRFELLIDGQSVGTNFGTHGADWAWQSGGTVTVEAGTRTLALHDLTGFDGRCDAIVFSLDEAFVPPNDLDGLKSLRRAALGQQTPVPNVREKPFDFVVVGGGMAGICSAVAAARLGLDVALIQNQFTLGGNNSSDIRVHLQGGINLPPYPNLGNIVYQLQHEREGNAEDGANYEDEKKFAVVNAEKNLHLFMGEHVEGVEKQGDKIVAVTARNIVTNAETRFNGTLFADCTGDGNLGFLAGADWRYGRESQAETGEPDAPQEADSMTMGASVQWYAVDTNAETSFPILPWAIQFTPESIRPMVHGDWDWETGLNWNQIDDFEKIRDHGLRAAYGHWSYMKNHADEEWTQRVKTMELGWVASYAGKRESRRLLGDLIIDEVDICGGRVWPDAAVTTTWGIDLHYPEKENEKHFSDQAFRTICVVRGFHPYAIPYRCFYSRNISNLFMAGRNISVTHAALGTIRVMRTGGMMGEVVGMAAAICVRHGVTPRGVYQERFDELKTLMTQGLEPAPPGTMELNKPAWLLDRKNLALQADVSASSEHESGQYPVSNIIDGKINPPGFDGRYVSASGNRHFVQFDFDQPTTVSALRFVVGPVKPERLLYRLEYEENGQWHTIPGTVIKNRHALDFSLAFEPVTATSFRLVQTIDYGEDLFRLWEVELY